MGTEDADEEPVPRAIDRYVVVTELGHGGMGRVYQAYDPALRRAVAIKVLHSGASSTSLARFRREAEMLARLEHPNVVRVFEVGTHDGAPFLVMELVQGKTLRNWLADGPTPARIRDVFVQAGRGLAAAHGEGIVHRDFKPDNVLVSRDGRVRVLDFGLGVLAGQSDDSTQSGNTRSSGPRVTIEGAVMGTPMYMSPEQHIGRPADHRSDQFSFCVALFQAIYRRSPFPGESLAQVRRAVTLGHVVAPRFRDADAQAMRTIALRGLQPRPDARWRAMTDVVARLESRRTRSRTLLVAVGCGAATIGIAAAAPLEPAPCDGDASVHEAVGDALRERADAAIRATDAGYANATADMLAAGIDEHASAWASAFRAYCASPASDERVAVGQCLDADLARLRARVDALALTDAESLASVVPAIRSLPDPARCSDPQSRAPEQPVPRDAKLAEEVEAIRGQIRDADALDAAGRHAEAESSAEAALATARATGYRPLIAEAALLLGSARAGTGHYEAARRSLEDAFFEASAADHAQVALEAAHAVLRHEARAVGRPEEMQQWADSAAAWSDRVADPEHARAHHRFALAEIHRALGQWDALVEVLRAALAEAEASAHDPMMVATVRSQLAIALHDANHFEEAVDVQRTAIARQRELLGDEHPAMAADWANLGAMLMTIDEIEDADAAVRRGIALYEATLGPTHPELGNAYGIHASVLQEQNRLPQAELAIRRALAIHRASMPPGHPSFVHDLRTLGEILAARGRHDEAEQAFAELQRELEASGRGVTSDAAVARIDVGKLRYAAGDDAAAIEQYDRAEAILIEAPDADPRAWSTLHDARSLARLRAGLVALARQDAERGLELASAAYGLDAPQTATASAALGRVHLAEERWDEAEIGLARAVAILEHTHVRHADELASALEALEAARARVR